MAAPELTSFTPGSTGNTTISLNGAGTPTYIEFWCGPRTGTTETYSMSSKGSVDIGNGNATFQSNVAGSVSQTINGAGGSTTSMCLTHYSIVGGAISKRIELKFVSAAAGQFTINRVTADANYTVFAKVTY